jgi:hypothetical protein
MKVSKSTWTLLQFSYASRPKGERSLLKRLTGGMSSRWVTGLLLIFWLTSPVTAQTVLTPETCDGESGYRPQKTDQPTTIQFVNQSSKAITINWLDFDGKRKPYATLSEGSAV